MVKQLTNFFKKYSFKKYKKQYLIASLALIVLGLLLFKLSFAALVNGFPITRFKVTRELEKQAGMQVLDNLIDKTLINQEAKRLGIKIDEVVVNAELKKIEDSLKSQGVDLNTALKERGQTKEGLIEQIRIQKIVEKILSGKINISDSDIKSYFDSNSSFYPKGTKLETVKNEIKDQIFQSKLMTEYQKWLAELRTKAKIFYFVKF